MKCRNCSAELKHEFINLGNMPPSNAYVSREKLKVKELYLPLRVMVCDVCWLVQTEDVTSRESLFTEEYAYFSSASSSWLAHARDYANRAISRFVLNKAHFVVEVASNDGYLLRNFVDHNIPCLGVEPTHSTASAARDLGIPVCEAFFGRELGAHIRTAHQPADLMIANNVLAHVPDIHDFVAGMAQLLSEHGVVSFEFPHLQNLLKHNQFDTIYHEHYSYLSLHSVKDILEQHDLRVFDVEKIATHGGSLRVWACRQKACHSSLSTVEETLSKEKAEGLTSLATYSRFQRQAQSIADALTSRLKALKAEGKRIVAYGAAAKGNTLLNYAGISTDLIDCVYDIAPSKQNKYLPGSLIPIVAPDQIREDQPDVVLVLPWNIMDEVCHTLLTLYQAPLLCLQAIPTLSENTITP